MIRLGDLELGPLPRIAVAITEADLPQAAAWAPLVDAIEVRVDLCAEPQPSAAVAVTRAAHAAGKPVLATVRWSAEGGAGALDDAARLALYAALAPIADGLDIELASPLCD
ncbi:MAG: type I 3-dehydroquinate dehydratase, partial [bacterium]